MKVYRVIDDGTPLPIVHDLAELGKIFVRLSAKYPQNDWFWVEEEIL